MNSKLLMLSAMILSTSCNLNLKQKAQDELTQATSSIEQSVEDSVDESLQEVTDDLIDDLDDLGGDDFPQGGELTHVDVPLKDIGIKFNTPIISVGPAGESESPEEELCQRAIKSECSGDEQVAEFDYCKVRDFSLAGSVSISHDSEESCQQSFEQGRIMFPEVGSQAVRDVSIQRIGPEGEILTVSGSSTYEILAPGDGFKVNKDKIRILSKDGQEKFNYRVVGNDLHVNQLQREGRRIYNGNVTVTHNLAGYTSSHTFLDLKWETACCYPSSGSINVLLTGSREKSATYSFSEICGLVQAEYDDGKSREVKLKNCSM